jgi:hypothetical protein
MTDLGPTVETVGYYLPSLRDYIGTTVIVRWGRFPLRRMPSPG